jgi:hypothetical protein
LRRVGAAVDPRDDSQLGERSSDLRRQITRLSAAHPTFERNFENRDARFGCKARTRVAHAAHAQCLCDGGGERGELDQIAFLQLGMRSD